MINQNLHYFKNKLYKYMKKYKYIYNSKTRHFIKKLYEDDDNNVNQNSTEQ